MRKQINIASENRSNIDKLKTYIKKSPYIEVADQRRICQSFGLHYMVELFRIEYRKRFYEYLKKNITSVATVSKDTEIPHKYLCEVKAYYEKKNLLQVVMMGKCPTTGSSNVQYLSTNPKVWSDSSLLPQSDQLSLFD